MTKRLAILALVLLGGTPAAAAPLELDDVLDGLPSHPAVTVADAGVERAEGERLAARGAFDIRTRVRTERAIGFYDRLVIDAELRKPTRLRGLSAFAGWRLGSGGFADYDLKSATFDRGEVRAGLDLPLLAGGAIDRARADERKATQAIALGRAERARRILELQRDAATAYWDWVAAGYRLEIRERQLELARRRDRDLQQTIRQGNTAPIEGVDNARLIVAREAFEVGARRDFARAAFELSFYLRRSGEPIMPDRSRLPPLGDLPPPLESETDVETLIIEARKRQPALAAIGARLEANRVDLDLATNQLLPSLNTSLYINRGIGTTDPLIPDRERPAAGASLTFELPLERSQARGAVAIARADRRRLVAEQQLVAERLAIDARFAVTELGAARQRTTLATEQARIADQLADAERTRFERGDSTILFVNLREEAAAEATASRIDAITDYLKARARYVIATGRSLTDVR